jgi:hypothetical protein
MTHQCVPTAAIFAKIGIDKTTYLSLSIKTHESETVRISTFVIKNLEFNLLPFGEEGRQGMFENNSSNYVVAINFIILIQN